ncbi:MAG: ParA family protein [Candidatus Babeliales bacterium]
MRLLAIINQKGGSGKTTTCVNVAAGLAEKKRSVLVIDLDSQGSTTAWLGVSKDTQGIYPVFAENVPLSNVIVSTEYKEIDCIPASSWLVGLDKRLAQEVGAETILRHQLEQLQGKEYDYVIIDCPPTLGVLTVNALCAVHEVIVPVEARFMALSGLVQLLETIDLIKKRLNQTLRIAGIVPCRVDARTKHSQEVVEELKNNFKGMVYKTAIRENIRLSEASSFAQPIMMYDSTSKGAYDYRALTKEIIKQENAS